MVCHLEYKLLDVVKSHKKITTLPISSETRKNMLIAQRHQLAAPRAKNARPPLIANEPSEIDDKRHSRTQLSKQIRESYQRDLTRYSGLS